LAIDAFREMLRREALLASKIMSMDAMDHMADICPKCYRKPVLGV
jgi:hypothetical protein